MTVSFISVIPEESLIGDPHLRGVIPFDYVSRDGTYPKRSEGYFAQ